MKHIIIYVTTISLLSLGTFLRAQQPTQTTPQELETEIFRTRGPTYNPEGRRDPFRNLLAGQEATEKGSVRGIRQVSIDDIVLIGITKFKEKLTAIINDAQGFPYSVKKGDTLQDGFVLSIDENRVVFRKTKERGIPLFKPKDIVKEIKLEER